GGSFLSLHDALPISGNGIRVELTVLIEGSGESDETEATETAAFWSTWDIPAHVAWYVEQGMSRMEAMKQVAKDRNMSKREVYRCLVESESESRSSDK